MDLENNKQDLGNVLFGIFIVLGLFLLIYLIKPVLSALSITLVLVYLLHPIVEKIEPHVKSRWLSITVTSFFILVPFFIFSIVLSSTIISQLVELSKTPQFNELISLLGENFKGYLELPSEDLFPALGVTSFSALREIFTQGFGTVVNFFKALGGLFLQLLLGIFLTVYILFKKESLHDLFNSIIDVKVRRFTLFVDEALKQVVYSMILTAVVTGILAVITYSFFGVPFAVLWGTTTGIVALIPLLGTWLVYTPISVYFFLNGQTLFALVFFVVSLLFVTILPDVAVRPIIASKQIDIGLIVLGFITGTFAFGAVGFIIGPLVIIAWVGFVRIFLLEEKT